MSEQERVKRMAAPEGQIGNGEDKPLRTLFRDAYRPVRPSDALERRVAEALALHPAGASPRRGRHRLHRLRWTAYIMAPAMLLAAVGYVLWQGRPATGQKMSPTRSVSPAIVAHRSDLGDIRRAPTTGPAGVRRLKPRATKAQSRPAPTVGAARKMVAQSAHKGRPYLAPHLPRFQPPGKELDYAQIEPPVRGVVSVQDDFITIPFPRVVSADDRQIAGAAASHKREAAIVDSRLVREVTLQFKATALSDLCDHLRNDTGIRLSAGPSVADEKVTVFCKKQPLRDVMRQLSRPFGYTWVRGGAAGEYRYELVQDLKSQLLEEELRLRDRHAALLVLEKEIERYRAYLHLSPDEAQALSKSASPTEKPLLEKLASWGWGPIHMYFRLSPRELAALRAGQGLMFSTNPRPGEQPLPSEVARRVLQLYRNWPLKQADGSTFIAPDLSVVPEARGLVTVSISQSELGRFTLGGSSGHRILPSEVYSETDNGPYAVGQSPAVLKPDNHTTNIKLTGDPVLRHRVSVKPQPSCPPVSPVPVVPDLRAATAVASLVPPEGRVTSADVLERLHQVTGLPIVADYYTRLYGPSDVSVTNQPLFDTLNHLAEAMRLRWNKAGDWLQFRSTSYYDDRLKEVPNRLLTRWAAARRQHGALPLDELMKIAELSDTQLDASHMAEGARECFGLVEWDLARNRYFRPHLRYLAQLTPAQRQEAQSTFGLMFRRMSLQQQQQFISLAISSRPDGLGSLEDLAEASLRMAYTQPGEFQWAVPEEMIGLPGRGTIGLSPVRGPTRMAALQSAQRIDPEVVEAQIVPTELAVTVVYTTGHPRTGVAAVARRVGPKGARGWMRHFPPMR